MKLTIIRDMGLVHVDGRGYDELDVSVVPEDVHAFQWDGSEGDIEYVSNDIPNEHVTSMPSWASELSSIVYAKLDADDHAERVAKEEHEAYLASDQYVKDTAIAEAKETLSSTDWVIAKISEAQLQGEDTAPLLTKYADELAQRATARDTINANGG